MNKKKLSIIKGAVILVACVSVLYLIFMGMLADDIETGENLASVTWLPDTASNVSYYKSTSISGVLSYECHMAEPDFLKYSKAQGWKVDAIQAPVSVNRYKKYIKGSQPLDYEIKIDKGYYYKKAASPSDSWAIVAYDAPRQVLYVNQGNL